MHTITLPATELRPYQREAFDKIVHKGCKRACLIWARRSGKDYTALSIMLAKAIMEKGLYFYCLPTYTQASVVIWKGKTNTGRNILEEIIPKELIAGKNNSDMTIKLFNGSIIKVVGSDNVDRLVGSNPRGVLFSEYSLADPRGWDLMRPILSNNGGWAMFVYTPRGPNHGKELYDMAVNNKDWYVSKLTCEETGSATLEDIQRERESGMPENLIRQEYYVDFTAATSGTYYAEQIQKMREDGRITDLPIDYSIPVNTAWDLGISDSTAITFYQRKGEWVHIIDYYESNGAGLGEYVKVLKEKGYMYDHHYFPHDIAHRDLSTGETRLDMLFKMGVKGDVVPMKSVNYGIECVHRLLPKTKINLNNCANLIKSLELYHKKFDEKNNVYMDMPVHGPESHAADAIRYMAIMERDRVNAEIGSVKQYGRPMEYKPMSW